MPVLDNARHEIFAQEIAKGEPAYRAYATAGFAEHRSNFLRLSRDPKVRARIDEIKGRAAVRAEVSIAGVLNELANIAFANMADYVRIGDDGDPFIDFSEMTEEQAAAVVEMTVEDFKDGRGEDARDVRRVKFKLADKRAALVDLGKYLGLFRDRVSVENPDGTPVNPVVIFQLPDNGRSG